MDTEHRTCFLFHYRKEGEAVVEKYVKTKYLLIPWNGYKLPKVAIKHTFEVV